MTTTTENGDKAFATSGSACLDFFVRITRNADITDYLTAFQAACAENMQMALQLLLNLRDARKGKGEKLIPIVIMFWLRQVLSAEHYCLVLETILPYGCWKDLLRIDEICQLSDIVSDKSRRDELDMMTSAFRTDFQKLLTSTSTNGAVAISLVAKWMPTENSHFDRPKIRAARYMARQLRISRCEYRKTCTKLRANLRIVETLFCQQRFEEIDFSHLPAAAHNKLKRALMRNTNSQGVTQPNREVMMTNYKNFIARALRNETKVKVTGLQPHEIVKTYFDASQPICDTTEAQWLSLKAEIQALGTMRNVTAVVDVSGSMAGLPMEVSVALGILVASCTQGVYHGQVITFHTTPTWQILQGQNLRQDVHDLLRAPWGGSTDLRAVFDMILAKAIAAKLAPEEMVQKLFIFTDMQFNAAIGAQEESTFEYARKIYAQHGYQLPKIICWNLRTSSTASLPITQDTANYCMLSGFSAQLLRAVLQGEDINPLAILQATLKPYTIPETLHTITIPNNSRSFNLQELATVVKNTQIKKAFLKKKA